VQRERLIPRVDWPQKVEALGFAFHTLDGEVYWDERACYRFSARPRARGRGARDREA
jgi:glutathionylspermidine synthase